MSALDYLLTGKIRLRLLMKFFLNPKNQVYLRGLSREFGVSTNTVRQELNKLDETGVLVSEMTANRKLFRVNEAHPLYEPIRGLLLNRTGIDRLFEAIIERLGTLTAVYLTGPIARGLDTPILDMIIVGQVDRDYVNMLTPKAEQLTGKKIRVALYSDEEWREDVLADLDFMQVIG